MEDIHISDEDLLSALDGELSPTRLAEIRRHLVNCWPCRARSTELERAIHAFITTYRDEGTPLPPRVGSRALLKARLANLLLNSQVQGKRVLPHLTGGALILAASGIVMLGVFAWQRTPLPGRHGFMPDPRLTPGATRSVDWNDICPASSSRHLISASTAKRVFEEYRIANPRPYAYEVDYLITPELGGADDIRNVWPEPYSGSEWTAHVKDALEEHLHQMVCDKQLELYTAQREIAQDWVSAYKRYFHADHPLPEHLAYTKDEPWR
jgi:hypothetical protein